MKKAAQGRGRSDTGGEAATREVKKGGRDKKEHNATAKRQSR